MRSDIRSKLKENSDILLSLETNERKIWWNSYAASSTTVAKKNSVLLSLEMTTTGSRGVSSSSSLLPEAVFVGSSIPGATRAAAPSAVSANLATEYPLRDLSQKPLEKPLHLSCTSLFFRHPSALFQQVAYLPCTKRWHAFWQHLQDPEWQSIAVSLLRRRSQRLPFIFNLLWNNNWNHNIQVLYLFLFPFSIIQYLNKKILRKKNYIKISKIFM